MGNGAVNEKKSIHPVYETLLGEHRELMAHINELREWVKEVGDYGRPRFGELGNRLEPLRDELLQHFAEEEEGGYLAEALAQEPRFAREAEELKLQHAEFQGDLNAFIERLHESEPPFESWQRACSDFEDILARIRRHEGRETAIVQAAFGDDIGHGD